MPRQSSIYFVSFTSFLVIKSLYSRKYFDRQLGPWENVLPKRLHSREGSPTSKVNRKQNKKEGRCLRHVQ
jgi:hypothetical protein